VKQFFKNNLGKFYRYYRLSYSVLATITLALLLYFQYSFESPVLIRVGWIKYVSFFILVLPGLLLMGVSIKKYFMLLSGVRSIYQPVPVSELKTDGIHRYMRHPLYTGTILFVCGLFFIFPYLNNFIAVVLLILYVYIGSYFEEKKLIKEFGGRYKNYMLNVPKLIPDLKLRPQR
jgi:protein-S-isoprenylcysteine O-methyltransferase Ste14